ncbi:MAG: AAA family ATPase [Bacteroidales bacterium]|nr:AAA family ATPase [Bacteroidales bacterium]
MTDPQENSEKRRTTILVTALDGLTNLTEESSSGRITQLLSRCMESMEEVVRLFSGEVLRFDGERMAAFFGIPDPRENFAVRALQASLEMKSRLREMIAEKELPERIGLRIGIATGEVIYSLIGSGKTGRHTVIGHVLDLASRILDLAEPGQILIGPETYRLTLDHFDIRSMEPVPVKGQKKPVQVYSVLARREERVAVSPETARMISSPVVGREKELNILKTKVMGLIVAGKGCVVTITGEAGVGKSRLMAEMKKQEAIGQVTFLEGKGISFGGNLSFHPINQVIRSWAGIHEDDAPAIALEKLECKIEQVYPEGTEEVFPFIATMMGFTLSGKPLERLKGIEGESLEKLILKNLRELLGEAVRRSPGFIVIEDLHWADLSTIHALEFLVKLVRNHRLVFVFIFRPGYEKTGEHLLKFITENIPDQFVHIEINNLGSLDSVRLMENLLGQMELPNDTTALIQEKTRGNPFFIEEVLRSFIDQGIIQYNEKGFEVTDKIKYANIPETINEVLLSRIDRLDEKTRNLLKMASVIGRNFYYKVLEEAADTIGELDDKLGYLKEMQFINESGTSDEVEYLFKHALAQQAAYESIVQKKRQEMHLKIARSIEKVFSGKIHEFYGVLALHYGKAEAQEKQEEYLVKAGEQALLSGASSEAIHYFKQALDLYLNIRKEKADPTTVIHLKEKIGLALETKGDNIEAVDYFDQALEFYGFTIPKYKFLRLLGAAFDFLWFPVVLRNRWLMRNNAPDDNTQKIARLIVIKGEALATLNPRRWFIDSIYAFRLFLKYDLNRIEVTTGILSAASTFYVWTGFSLKTGELMLENAFHAMSGKNDPFESSYRFAKRMHDYFSGRWTEDQDMEEVYHKATHSGTLWDIVIYLLYSGFILVEKGHWEKALAVRNKLLDVSENFENSHAKAQAFRLFLLYCTKTRSIEEGLKTSEEGIRFTTKTGHMAMLLVIYCEKCRLHTFRGEFEPAAKALKEAENLVRERKLIKIYFSGYLLANCWLNFAESLASGGNKSQKLHSVLKKTNQLIRSSKTIYSNLTEAYRLRALVYWHLKRQGKALKDFHKSLGVAEKYGVRPELARTCFELGKCLKDPNSRHNHLGSRNGSEYLGMAKSMFQEMNLKWDMQEYDRYMGI